ncbi:DUF4400 domain-containing protein [Paraburkholderia sp. MM5477-R1]|uniref:DUF4400 domain-containing protein n=1 Tax=Paraburkholderia sp. MM5477-R1 TaxID=2991062 RepID=UPI003D211D69
MPQAFSGRRQIIVTGPPRDSNADGVKSFFWLFDTLIHLGLWLLLITFFAVLADLAAAWFWWRDDPVGGIEALVRYYLEQTTDPELAQQVADAAYWSWFGWTGIDASARAWQAGIQPTQGLASVWRPMFFGDPHAGLIVAMYGVRLFGIRAAMLAMTVPQFTLAMVVAVVDGLVARYVRRAQGAHESATRYHHAKRLLIFGLIPVLAIVWLVSPVKLPIDALFWPVSLAVVMALWTMARFYKKYF